MKIVIPMSGLGSRFQAAGYKDPKPLIKVDGMPIIEHVVNMYPTETNFLFICREEHLQNTDMAAILKRIAPEGQIISIEAHKKGPVYAVSEVFEYIDDNEEVIINYCDFSCYWDYYDFLNHTRNRNADGAIPSYRGFHPHMLGSTNYAFIRDVDQWLLEIKEKEPFTDNRMNEYASSGTYYFKNGAIVKKYFKQLMDENHNLNGEFYVSLVYNLLQRDGLKTSIYEIQHMLQWGTPEDLEEYVGWSKCFSKLVDVTSNHKENHLFDGLTLIPMAGAGSRFSKMGYTEPKPLIQVSGKAMVIQAIDALPHTSKYAFVCQQEHLSEYSLANELEGTYPDVTIIPVDRLTEGQACTCLLAKEIINPDKPLIISACDNGVLWNKQEYDQILKDESVDVIVWSFRNHASSKRNPQMYGWIKTDENQNIKEVSVKQPISDKPYKDHAIIGTFYFRKGKYFLDAVKQMMDNEIRVNGEFYVDSCINEIVIQGLSAKVFEVEHYICWGTPNDLLTFEYWQSFFHKWPWHDYSLHNDWMLEKGQIAQLDLKSRHFSQKFK